MNYTFNIFENIYGKRPKYNISSIDELRDILTQPEHVSRVNNIRKLYSEGKNVDKEKLNLLCAVCPGVVCDYNKDFQKENVLGNDFSTLDFDHLDADVCRRLVECIKSRRHELNVKLIQYGVRHTDTNGSLHVVIGKQVEESATGDAWIRTQQEAFMQRIHEEVPEAQLDEAVVHYGRKLFLTLWTDIVFISKDFFEYNASTVNPFRNTLAPASAVSTPAAAATVTELQPVEAEFQGIPLNKIAERWVMDKYHALNVKGSGHAILLDAVHNMTCFTTDPAELLFCVQNICPAHDALDTVRICFDAKKMPMSMIPNAMTAIVAELKENASPDDTPLPEPTPAPAEPQSSSATLCTHTCAMPQALPAGVKAFLNIFPENLREMALNLLLGGLQLYCSFETVGTTGGAEPVVLDVCSVGDFGSGKTAVYQCVSKYITARVKAKDAAERAKLEAWRQQKVQKNNSGSISAQPKVQVRIFSNASRNQILSYAVNQPGVTMLVSTDEAQPLAMAERRSNFSNISELLRQGYNNGTLSNDTLSTTSCNASSEVKCGSLICTQSAYVYDMYGDGFDGLASRVIFHLQASPSLETLKRGYEGFKFPDAAGVAVIEQMLDTLSSATGAFDLKGTKRVLQNWFCNIIDEYQEELKRNPDKADKTRIMLAPRCIQSALRAATMMYVLDGQRESKLVTDFALYIASKSLESLWVLYGDKIKENKFNEAINKKAHEYKKISTNSILLGLLPEVFTVDDMQKALAHEHMASASQNASNRISIMLKAKLIEKKGKGQWKKSIISK